MNSDRRGNSGKKTGTEKPPHEILKNIAPPILVSVDNPSLFESNPLNPRGMDSEDDLKRSFRMHGYTPYQEAATGNVYHIVAFRSAKDPEKFILLRGHRRCGTLAAIFKHDVKTDPDKRKALNPGEHDWHAILKHAQAEYNLDKPGIPVLVYEDVLTERQQLALILDEDSSQKKKDARMQLAMYKSLVANGWNPQSACRQLGFSDRYMPFLWATSGVLPDEVVEAWQSGGPGAEKRMVDKEFKTLYEKYRDAAEGKIKMDEAHKSFEDWKASKETTGDGENGGVVSKPATEKQLESLIKKLSVRNQDDKVVKIATLVAAYASGKKREGGTFIAAGDRDALEVQILELLPPIEMPEDQAMAANAG